MKYIHNWDEESKCATCIIQDKNQTFYGLATCHPDDEDMMNKNTGLEIATRRAEIKYYKFQRNTLKIKLSSLNQLYNSIKNSQKFNPKSYESRMLKRQIFILNSELDIIKEIIANLQENLTTYINLKDEFYQGIRKNRGRGNRTKINPLLDTDSSELRKILNNIEILDNIQKKD